MAIGMYANVLPPPKTEKPDIRETDYAGRDDRQVQCTHSAKME